VTCIFFMVLLWRRWRQQCHRLLLCWWWCEKGDGSICKYCIFENCLMKIIIQNDVSIICFKCVYCFKSL
jgi:hypothetical protein